MNQSNSGPPSRFLLASVFSETSAVFFLRIIVLAALVLHVSRLVPVQQPRQIVPFYLLPICLCVFREMCIHYIGCATAPGPFDPVRRLQLHDE